MTRDLVLSQIQTALDAIEMHLRGIEVDQSISRIDKEQLLHFRKALMSMNAKVERGDSKGFRPWMGRAIVDGWPPASRLGDLILQAEEAFSRYSEI